MNGHSITARNTEWLRQHVPLEEWPREWLLAKRPQVFLESGMCRGGHWPQPEYGDRCPSCLVEEADEVLRLVGLGIAEDRAEAIVADRRYGWDRTPTMHTGERVAPERCAFGSPETHGTAPGSRPGSQPGRHPAGSPEVTRSLEAGEVGEFVREAVEAWQDPVEAARRWQLADSIETRALEAARMAGIVLEQAQSVGRDRDVTVSQLFEADQDMARVVERLGRIF